MKVPVTVAPDAVLMPVRNELIVGAAAFVVPLVVFGLSRSGLLAMLLLAALYASGNYLAAPAFAIVNNLHLEKAARTALPAHAEVAGDMPALLPAQSAAPLDD